MAIRTAAAFAALCLAPSEARFLGTESNADLLAGLSNMQPEVVGHLLIEVEKRWEEGCVSALRKQVTEEAALVEMTKSCTKVTKAIVDGSDGDKDRVVEYMGDVCETVKDEQGKKTCNEFSSSIESFLGNNPEVNRNELNMPKFCQGFWASKVEVSAKTQVKKLEDADAAQTAKEEADRKQKEANEQAAADTKNEQNLKEAVSKTQDAQQDESKVDTQVKATESAMATDEEAANKLVDKARAELQAASENEAAAAEAKIAAETAAAAAKAKIVAETAAAAAEAKLAAEAAAKDEAAAIAAGDAKADAIAAKATVKAETETKAEGNNTDVVVAKAVTVNATAVEANATKKELAAAQIKQDPCSGCAEPFAAQHQKCMATMSNNPCTKQYTGVAFDNACCGIKQQHGRCLSCKSQGARPHYNSKWTDQKNSGKTVTEGYRK